MESLSSEMYIKHIYVNICVGVCGNQLKSVIQIQRSACKTNSLEIISDRNLFTNTITNSFAVNKMYLYVYINISIYMYVLSLFRCHCCFCPFFLFIFSSDTVQYTKYVFFFQDHFNLIVIWYLAVTSIFNIAR